MRFIRLAIGATALALFAVMPAAAQSYRPLELPLDAVGGFVLDEAHGQMYVSEGAGGSEILVLDLDGRVVDTISNLAGPNGLALSEDGETLWVALRHADAAVGYSTETFAEVDRVDLPAATCPNHVVESLGKLVIDPDGICGGTTYLVVDLEGDRTPVPVVGLGSFPLGAVFVASPENPGIVVAGKASSSPTLTTIDISGPEPVVLATRELNGRLYDLAIDPTGTQIVLGPERYGISVLDVADLRLRNYYPKSGENRATGVAWSADGQTIAEYSFGVSTFQVGDSDVAWLYRPEGYSGVPGGLAINANGSVVYFLTTTGSDDVVELWIRTVGVSPGSISGWVEAHDGINPDLGKVELYDDDFRFLTTQEARSDYKFDDLEPGTYYLFFWNGDETHFWDYFPRWFSDAPMFRLDQATPVVVGSGEDVTGIDMVFPPLYFDMFESVFVNDIFWLGNTGITRGCNPPSNTLFCVDEPVSRGQMAAFLARALGLTDNGSIDFVDDDGSIFETDIERLAAAGITRGCNPPDNTMFCPDDLVTRGQLAAFLVRALGLSEQVPVGFIDDDGSIFETDIERLAAAGITRGCNPPSNTMFCPDEVVTRGQMAAFLHRALGT